MGTNRTRQVINPRRKIRGFVEKISYVVFLLSVCVGIAGLILLLFEVFTNGIPWVSWDFITEYPSRHPEEAGLFSALMGTMWLMGMTAIFTVPVGVGAAIYLEEYAPKNWLTRAKYKKLIITFAGKLVIETSGASIHTGNKIKGNEIINAQHITCHPPISLESLPPTA